MPNLSSANAVFSLGVASVFVAPQQLSGFAADDIFSTDAINSAETQMGVDGKLSAGFVFVPIPQTITLQADSDSVALFEEWWNAQQAAKDIFYAFGNVALISVNRNYVLTKGALTSYSPMPDAGRVLRPRKFGITWESIYPVPTS